MFDPTTVQSPPGSNLKTYDNATNQPPSALEKNGTFPPTRQAELTLAKHASADESPRRTSTVPDTRIIVQTKQKSDIPDPTEAFSKNQTNWNREPLSPFASGSRRPLAQIID